MRLLICILSSLLLFLNSCAHKKKKEGGMVEDLETLLIVPMENRVRKLPDRSQKSRIVEKFKKLDKRGPIFFFIVDTLRNEYVTEEYAPFLMKDFSKEAFRAKLMGGATATQHGTFGLIHSLPSFLTMEEVLDLPPKGDDAALAFRIFKKLGYDLYALGFNYNTCSKKSPQKGRWHASLQSYWGVNTRLNKTCEKHEEFLKGIDSIDYNDYFDGEVFDKALFLARNYPDNFYYMHLEAPHDFYSWPDSIRPSDPFLRSWVFSDENDSRNSLLSQYKNAYSASIRGLDLGFKNFVASLKKSGIYEDSTIVIVGDHGESLADVYVAPTKRMHFKNGVINAHGGALVKHQIETTAFFKFPKALQTELRKKDRQETIAAIDVMPTLFEALGYEAGKYDLAKLMLGESMFSKNSGERSFLSAMPNGSKPTNHMVMINSDTKVFIRMSEDKFFDQDYFEVIQILDPDDKALPPSHPYVELMKAHNHEKLRKEIKEDFSEALSLLFSEW